jgi:hypothetical protein
MNGSFLTRLGGTAKRAFRRRIGLFFLQPEMMPRLHDERERIIVAQARKLAKSL